MFIRYEKPGDYAAVHAVNSSAFETSAEADLVDVLRKEVQPVISLVAEQDDQIAGHILFSPAIMPGFGYLKIMGLGPMAVKSEYQNQGIGSALVRQGLEACRRAGFGAVIVLGHTWFYPRFGFIPSVKFGIRSEYDVPEEAFMVIELTTGYLKGVSGIIKYHPAFNNV
jgi:putative acetyltransferase